ncbi:MAG: hypothetical protein HC828_03110 [Blastochloris sp.]|nr:hypothetical protein [Blastochloris sp.]
MSTDTSRAVSPIPEGYAMVAPWVITNNTTAFIEFVRGVFGAREHIPPVYTNEPQTRVAHAEVQIGDSVLMLFDRDKSWVPTPAFLNIYVENCDAGIDGRSRSAPLK